MIDYDRFQKSLEHLEAQFKNFQTLDERLPKLLREAVAESVIQRFETCWDCLWKVLKRYLKEEIALPEVPNGPNPILRLANENNLLPGKLEGWLGYAKARVDTSHDYSGEKAQDALTVMGDFVDDAVKLYQVLSGEIWERRELENLDVTASQRKEITSLLKRYLPGTEVWAYGSRVKFSASPSSDLDMVAFVSKEQSLAVANLREAFKESFLPFRVDLFVWDEVPEQFHHNIKAERVVLQEKSSTNPPES